MGAIDRVTEFRLCESVKSQDAHVLAIILAPLCAHWGDNSKHACELGSGFEGIARQENGVFVFSKCILANYYFVDIYACAFYKNYKY